MSSKQLGSKISHGLKLMTNLEKLREQRCMCDFTIKVGPVHFDVHRAVLAACSGYFRAMLDEPIDEGGVVYINGIEPKAMETCVDFMYSGEANISVDNAESILDATELLQLEGLYAVCMKYLAKNIRAGNCFFIKKIAVLHEKTDLEIQINRFIIDNMEDVVETEDFLCLSKLELSDLFMMCRHVASSQSMSKTNTTTKLCQELEPGHKSDSRIFISKPTSRKSSANPGRVKTSALRAIKSAPVSSHSKSLYFVLWKAVTNWINHDVQERLICITELCDYIELARFPLTFLTTTVWKEPQVQASETCKNTISSIVLSGVKTLEFYIDVHNCFNIYKMAIVYSSENVNHIINNVFDFISKNLKSLKKRPEVQFWTENDICLFFKSCRNLDLNESDIWETAMTWFRFDNERRQQQSAMNILESINVQVFSPQFVLTVLKEPFIRESMHCVEYLGGVVFYDEKLLVWNIDFNTCFTIKYLARTYKNSIFGNARQHVLSFFVTNFQKVAAQPEFCHLLFEEVLHLCKILKKRNIHGEVKWTAIMKWVRYNEAERMKHLPALLGTISFERLSSDFIRKTVRFERLVQRSSECNDIVTSAVYKKLP